MAQRRKCSTDFVQNDKARLATFKRRSHCLMKKASELSTLCDVDVAVVIYADHLPDRPLVYPPDSGESLRIIKKLKENPRCVPAAKSKSDKFLNQANHNKSPNDKFSDDITSWNAGELNSLLRVLDAKEAEVQKKLEAIEQRKNEAAVDKVSDPNRFLFSGNDHRSELFDNQPHGFQDQIPFSEVDNEDSSKRSIKNNYGFMNQVSGDVNNNYNDEITCYNVGEAAVDEICDPNYFIFSGDDRRSALLDDQQDGFQWPISFSVMGEDNTTPKSKSERFAEENSSSWNVIYGHPNNIHYDELMSLDISESDLAQIMDDIEEYEIRTIGEKSDHIPDCWTFPESFYDEFSDPKCFFLSGGGWPNPSVSESTEVFDFQTASSSWAMAIPCSEKAEDTLISKPHHSIENNSGLQNFVAPVSIVEGVEAQSESNIVNQKEIETSCFTESSEFGSLAAIFSDEIPDVNGLFFNSDVSWV